MKNEEIFRVLVLIEFVYPHFKIKNDWVLHWFTLGKDMNFTEVMKNLYAHIRKSPYPPSIEDIAVFTKEDSAYMDCIFDWRSNQLIDQGCIKKMNFDNYKWTYEYKV